MRRFVLAGAATALLVTAACGPPASGSGCKDKLIAGDLVITEVFADAKAPPGGSGTDEGKEWFEIYNASGRPVELKGLTITHSRPDGIDKAKSHTMDDLTIAPGQYLTLGNVAQDLVPAYVDYGYGADLGDMFNTDGGKLVLACGDQQIDTATYESVKEGRARQLTSAQPPDYTLNDDAINWCEARDTEFEGGNFGTPGSENDCSPIIVGQCTDGGTMRDAVLPVEGDLLITEVMPNPGAVGDTDGEWFEIKALNAFDLNGVGLDRAVDTANPTVLSAPTCLHLAAGNYATFVKTTDTALNGGIPAGTVRGKFTFALVDGTTTAPGDVRVMSGPNVIDAISWTSTRSGKSHALDPDIQDPAANDDPSNFCDGAAMFGAGDFGTPGAANPQCGGTTLGMCNAGGTLRPIVKPATGKLVITEFLANPAGTIAGVDAAQEWFEIANIGTTSFDLNDLGLKGSSTTINKITSADCKPIPPAGFALFAHGTDAATNGGLPAPDATFTFALSQGSTATPGGISILDGTTVLDAITWTSSTDGAADQLKPTNLTTTANDIAANYCKAKAPQLYGSATNFGTPKAISVCLP